MAVAGQYSLSLCCRRPTCQGTFHGPCPMPELSLCWRHFLVPKSGHAAEECEDAIAGDPSAGRFAVADGASESYAAGHWARLLVDAFVTTGPAGDWLKDPREAWR